MVFPSNNGLSNNSINYLRAAEDQKIPERQVGLAYPHVIIRITSTTNGLDPSEHEYSGSTRAQRAGFPKPGEIRRTHNP